MVMALVWNNAKSFKQHVERMRMFRLSGHTGVEVRLALLESMPTSQVTHSMSETGGSRGFIDMSGEPALIPMRKVALNRNTQN